MSQKPKTEREEMVFIDEGKTGDMLKKTRDKAEVIIPEMAEEVQGLILDRKHHWLFLALDEKGMVELKSNIDYGTQIDMLEDAIANLKRIGQKV